MSLGPGWVHANEVHQTDGIHPVEARAVPDQDPEWHYNILGGTLVRNWFITCLPASIHKATLRTVNYEKVQGVIQKRYENPSQFLNYLTKVVLYQFGS